MTTENFQEFVLLDFSSKPENPRVQVMVELPSGGNIRMETGADGAWLLFDGECEECLPYCKAQCCSLIGTCLTLYEAKSGNYQAYWDNNLNAFVLKRDADGYCTYLDRRTSLCTCHENKPNTCEEFHCTRGSNMRGWKLANGVHRLA